MKTSYQSVNIASDVWIGMVSILQIHTSLINVNTSLINIACDVTMLISDVLTLISGVLTLISDVGGVVYNTQRRGNKSIKR